MTLSICPLTSSMTPGETGGQNGYCSAMPLLRHPQGSVGIVVCLSSLQTPGCMTHSINSSASAFRWRQTDSLTFPPQSKTIFHISDTVFSNSIFFAIKKSFNGSQEWNNVESLVISVYHGGSRGGRVANGGSPNAYLACA